MKDLLYTFGQWWSLSVSFLQKLPDYWMVKLGSLILGLLGAVGGLIIVSQWIRQKFFYKRIRLNKIKRLAAGTNIGFFSGILGAPVFIKDTGDFKTFTYVDLLFYVEAITNLSNQVLVFSVTTRDKNFNPEIVVGPFSVDEKIVRVKLGTTRFSELDSLGFEGKVESGAGNRRTYYTEEYYYGNPGLYQTYLFSLNDAGSYSAAGEDEPSIFNCGATKSSDPSLVSFRDNVAINTYTITSPFFNLANLNGTRIGVDYDEVRVLPD